MKISNETRVGILAAISITVLILGYNFMKGKEVFKTTQTFYAIYPKIDGLKKSNFVSINGYEVGTVRDIQLIPADSFKLLVRIEVNDDIQVPSNSKLKIVNFDLFGNKAIEIIMGNSTTYGENGDTLNGFMEANLVSSITSIVSPLKDKLDLLLANLNTLLGGESGQNLEGIIANTEKLSANLILLSERVNQIMTPEETRRIANMMANADAIIKNFRDQNEKISSILSNLDKVSKDVATSDLKLAIDNANKSLAELNEALAKINNGEGTLGKLANNDSLYNNLSNSAGSLDKLLKDMEKNPKRYVHFSMFGKKDKTPDPPREEKR